MKFALKIIFIFLIFVAILILLAPAKQKLSYGVTFSQKFSEEFGFESANGMAGWKRNYFPLLDDFKVKDFRLVAYLGLVETPESQFNFKDLDWQITEAEKRGAKIILVVGRKVPRWPECHIPSWARFSTPPGKKSDFFGVSKSDFEEGGVFQRAQLLNYIKTTIEHYRSNPAIIAWQVENEPLFPFGECGTIPVSLLNQEIKLVKSLSNKPVILTDSGELGFAWPYLAAKSDIFGTTLYRYINNRFLGDIRYSLIPAYYFRVKAWWAEKVFGKQILISELQAEPWNNGAINPEIFKEIIDYAERSGFPKAYLWGAEWWYFMKEKQGKPEMWEAARNAINNF